MVARENTETRVDRLVALARDDLPFMSVEGFKEVVRIQLGLARLLDQRDVRFDGSLHGVISLVLMSISSGSRKLQTMDSLVQYMFDKMGFEIKMNMLSPKAKSITLMRHSK